MKPHPITVAAISLWRAWSPGRDHRDHERERCARAGVPISRERIAATPQVDATVPGCSLAAAGSASAIRVSGTCSGRLTGAFTCTKEAELLALSIKRSFGRQGRAFYLTLVVPDFAGPGAYSDVAAVAQITGLRNVSRWSNRALHLRVGANGAVELDRTALAPEPGTPANGRLTLRGRASCAG